MAMVAWEATDPNRDRESKRRAHVKYVTHACDTSCVKNQRLVEHRCALPNEREKANAFSANRIRS